MPIKRLFPRIKINVNVGFDFVKWNEKNVYKCSKAYEASITDISAKGASLSNLPDIGKSTMKKLYNGTNKIRLNFLLNPTHDPINTFARLVWNQIPDKEGHKEEHYGFEFIDIPNTSFQEIKTFVDTAASKECNGP